MKYEEISVMLTCHSLDDFPVYHEGDDAESLLSSWTAIWHPHLIAHTGKLPRWHRTDLPLDPVQIQNCLIVIPRTSRQAVGDQQIEQWRVGGATVIDSPVSVDEILATALPALGELTAIDDELTADFLALGYAYLQLELLTRQMRYSTNVSESVLGEHLTAAARSAAEQDRTKAEELLQACYDYLSQERSNYYAVDVFLLDLALWAKELGHQGLSQQLEFHPKTNLLSTAADLETLRTDAPQLLSSIASAIDEKRWGLVGGEYRELGLPLISTDTLRGQLKYGLQQYQQLIRHRPHVFARRRFGLNPSVPQLLQANGYRGVLHATLDGGHYPQATQAKSRWEGDAQVSLDTIGRPPLDATRPETFLNLAGSISESMDTDHVATRCFAHWAGQRSRWYDTLLRVTKRTQALGRFTTFDEYLSETYDPGIHDQYAADQYRSPFLVQEVDRQSPQPISATVDYWQHLALTQSMLTLTTMRALVDGSSAAIEACRAAEQTVAEFTREADCTERWQAAAEGWRQALLDVAGDLVRSTEKPASPRAAKSSAGIAVVNPLCFPRRVGLLAGEISQPLAIEPPVYAVHTAEARTQVVVDAPAMGWVRIGSSGSSSRRGKTTQNMGEELSLRNEFLEAVIDPHTGTLKSLRDYGTRGNRLSQQLAFRLSDEKPTEDAPHAGYSIMAADSVRLVESTPVVAEIHAAGRLLTPEGELLAEFRQTYRLLRGSRVLQLGIELTPHRQPSDDPWTSYYCARFAWSNEAADVARSFCDSKRVTSTSQFEAPLFWETDDGHQRTTVLTGGLPYHRRIGRRMIDTLLLVKGETRRSFQLGLGVDLKQPFREAWSMLLPPLIVTGLPDVAQTNSPWLFHVDARNVLATEWAPVWDNDRLVGVRVGLAEVDGRSTRVTLQSFRPIQRARKVDGAGQSITHYETSGEQASLSINARELLELELIFVD